MIQPQTCLRVADNSGAKKLMCIRVLGSNRRYGYVGDVIIGVVKDATPNLTVKRSDVVRAVIVRTKQSIRRKDGSRLRFDDNASVIINKENNYKYSKIYNFVNSGPVVSWFEFANFIKLKYSLFKRVNSKIVPISSLNFYNNSIRPEFSALDNNKLINDFNYQIENWQTSIITLLSNKFKS